MMTRVLGQSTGLVIVRATFGGKKIERDFVQCPHCEAVLELQPGKRVPIGEYGYCDHCHAFVCPTEACLHCRPFERVIEEHLNAMYHRQQFVRAVGLDGR